MYSEYPKFHPNGFTSGGVTVIAKRVNTVQTRHKVFPILGEAIASRRLDIGTKGVFISQNDHQMPTSSPMPTGVNVNGRALVP